MHRNEREEYSPCTLVDHKRKRYDNAVDVVVRLHDPTDPSTESMTPPRSAHIRIDDVPQTHDPAECRGRASPARRRDDGDDEATGAASPKHYDDMTEVDNGGGGHRTRLGDQGSTCVSMGCPLPRI